MAEIMMPKKQEGSIGRRLFSMAAPIVGGALGGPAGAMAGSMIGSKVGGANTQDAMAAGLSSGADAFSRRTDALSKKPDVAVKEGLDVLSSLPQDNPLRQQYGPALVRANMISQKNFGAW